MTTLQRTFDGLAFEDGVLDLADGRKLAWRWYGEPGGTPVLSFQGMPSSRLERSPDPAVQGELGVRYLLADRPGYGGSSRKPGHGIADLTDDLVALLDALGLGRVPVIGISAGGPHALAFAACHPDRVRAAAVVAGAAPLTPEEAAGLVEFNARGYLVKQRGWAPLYRHLVAARDRMAAEDRDTLKRFERLPIDRLSRAEGLRQGAEGWADESYALRGEWDFDPARIKAAVTWWHGEVDRNAPMSAARRAAARIPRLDFRVWEKEGHEAVYAHEREVVEDLLSRSR